MSDMSLSPFVDFIKKACTKKAALLEESLGRYAARSIYAGAFLTLSTAAGAVAADQINTLHPSLGRFLFAFIFAFGRPRRRRPARWAWRPSTGRSRAGRACRPRRPRRSGSRPRWWPGPPGAGGSARVDWNRIARYNSGMSTIQLTDDELRILQDHRKGAPHKLMRLKSEAIIMLSMGASKKFAAEFVERSIETIKK